jgi:molybdenum transport protein
MAGKGENMRICLPDHEIERCLEEDVPYGDLTTTLLEIGSCRGSMVFSAREETILCGCEEAGRVFEKCGATVSRFLPTGTRVQAGGEFLVAEGTAESLHAGWKVALNLLEYGSGIATRTGRIVAKAKSINPAVAVVATRKSFPGTKRLSIKAVVAGGALPHRLGLSDSVLVFKQHTLFLGGLEPFLEKLPSLRRRAPENTIMVEAETAEEAIAIARAGVDVLQIDKLSPTELTSLVPRIRALDSEIKISAAGGINESNVLEYASTGVDIIVLSSVYFGKPADIAARMTATPS